MAFTIIDWIGFLLVLFGIRMTERLAMMLADELAAKTKQALRWN